MRLDKFLSECGYTRKEATNLISRGYVKINGELVTKKDYKLNETADTVSVYN